MSILRNISILSVTAATLLIAGCGGGGGSSATSGASGSSVSTASGIFLDAPVSGISYTSGSTTGTTGADGSFTYEVGKPVTFKLGGVTLGTATPASSGKAVITPVDLVSGATSTTNATVEEMGSFLQTLDSDQNPANGIQITSAEKTAASGQSVDFTNAASVNAALAQIAPTHTVVTPTAAATNMQGANKAAIAGHYTGTYTGSCNNGQSGTYNWVLDIDTSGKVTGESPTSSVVGSITSMGSVSATGGGTALGGSATWTGTVKLNGGDVSGTWAIKSQGCSGTFTGSKSTATISSYVGTYSGVFNETLSGGTKNAGTLSLTVASSGAITGSGTSPNTGAFTLSGTVNNNGTATFNTTVANSTPVNITFNGDGGYVGSYSSGSASGTFSGFRQ